MKYKDIQSIALIYGNKKKMKAFLNYFYEFWERDGDKLQFLEIKKTDPFFKDLKKFIWKGD